jgi:hypothetical protein
LKQISTLGNIQIRNGDSCKSQFNLNKNQAKKTQVFSGSKTKNIFPGINNEGHCHKFPDRRLGVDRSVKTTQSQSVIQAIEPNISSE